MTKNSNSFAVSSVKYINTEGNERKRIVVDISEEHSKDFMKTWKEWNDKWKDWYERINLTPSHDEIHGACGYLSKQIIHSNFKPDYIVGLTRGGLPIAVILSHMLDNTLVIPVNYSSSKGKGDNKNHSNDLPNITGKKLLLVDDLTDSAHTMKEVSDYYKKYGNEVRTLVIHYKKHDTPVIIPDFYWVEIPEDSAWIIYPWENNS